MLTSTKLAQAAAEVAAVLKNERETAVAGSAAEGPGPSADEPSPAALAQPLAAAEEPLAGTPEALEAGTPEALEAAIEREADIATVSAASGYGLKHAQRRKAEAEAVEARHEEETRRAQAEAAAEAAAATEAREVVAAAAGLAGPSDEAAADSVKRAKDGYIINAINNEGASHQYFLGDDGSLKFGDGEGKTASGHIANQVRTNINELLDTFGYKEQAANYAKVAVKSDSEGRVPEYKYIFDENSRVFSKEPLKLHRTIMLGDMAKRVLPMNATRYFVTLKEHGLLLDGVLGNRDTNNFDLARIISSLDECKRYIESCKKSILDARREYTINHQGAQPTYGQLKDYYHANRERLSLEYVDPGKELMLNKLDSATFNVGSQAEITLEGIEAGFDKAPKDFSDKQDLIIQYKNDECFGYPGGFEYYLLNAWINSIEETLMGATEISEEIRRDLLSQLQKLAETPEFDAPDSSLDKVDKIYQLIIRFNDDARKKGVEIDPIALECFKNSRDEEHRGALHGLNVIVKQFFKDHEPDGPIFKTFENHCVTAKTMVIGGVNVRLAHYPSLLVHGNAQGLEDELTLANAYSDESKWERVGTASRPSQQGPTITAHPVGVDLKHQLPMLEGQPYTYGLTGHNPVKADSGPQVTADNDMRSSIIFADTSRSGTPNNEDVIIGGKVVVVPGYLVTCKNKDGDVVEVQTTQRIRDYTGRWIKGAPNLELPASVLKTLFPEVTCNDKCEITGWIIDGDKGDCLITASKGRANATKLCSYEEVKAAMKAIDVSSDKDLVNIFTRTVHQLDDQLVITKTILETSQAQLTAKSAEIMKAEAEAATSLAQGFVENTIAGAVMEAAQSQINETAKKAAEEIGALETRATEAAEEIGALKASATEAAEEIGALKARATEAAEEIGALKARATEAQASATLYSADCVIQRKSVLTNPRQRKHREALADTVVQCYLESAKFLFQTSHQTKVIKGLKLLLAAATETPEQKKIQLSNLIKHGDRLGHSTSFVVDSIIPRLESCIIKGDMSRSDVAIHLLCEIQGLKENDEKVIEILNKLKEPDSIIEPTGREPREELISGGELSWERPGSSRQPPALRADSDLRGSPTPGLFKEGARIQPPIARTDSAASALLARPEEGSAGSSKGSHSQGNGAADAAAGQLEGSTSDGQLSPPDPSSPIAGTIEAARARKYLDAPPPVQVGEVYPHSPPPTDSGKVAGKHHVGTTSPDDKSDEAASPHSADETPGGIAAKEMAASSTGTKPNSKPSGCGAR